MSPRTTFLLATMVTVLVGAGAVAALGGGLLRTGDDQGARSTRSPPAEPTGTPTPSASTSPAQPRSTATTPTPPGTATAGPSPTPTRVQQTTYAFPVARCNTSYAAAHHDYQATDIFAARDCLFVSPVAGVVDEVTRTDRWSSATNVGADRGGLSVSVVGVDGVRYYGSHLGAVLPGIAPGMRVKAGTPLGRVGDTGSARGTGTHLHFGISWPTAPGRWWVRRGAVPPVGYLDAWQAGRDLSPAQEVARARRQYGDDSRCHGYC